MPRAVFEKLIIANGGLVSKTVTNSVTHLVSTETGTKKCMDAEAKGVNIVNEQWVRSMLDEGSDNTSSVAAPPAKKAVVPEKAPADDKCLANMNICISGTLSRSRADIEELLINHGASISKSVTKAVTHLICSEDSAANKKHKDAAAKGVQLINEDWIYAQIGIGNAENPPVTIERASVRSNDDKQDDAIIKGTVLPLDVPLLQRFLNTYSMFPADGRILDYKSHDYSKWSWSKHSNPIMHASALWSVSFNGELFILLYFSLCSEGEPMGSYHVVYDSKKNEIMRIEYHDNAPATVQQHAEWATTASKLKYSQVISKMQSMLVSELPLDEDFTFQPDHTVCLPPAAAVAETCDGAALLPPVVTAAEESASLAVTKATKSEVKAVAYRGTIILDPHGESLYDISDEDKISNQGAMVGDDPIDYIRSAHPGATVSCTNWKILIPAFSPFFEVVRVKRGRDLIASYNVCYCPFGMRNICPVQIVKTFDISNMDATCTYEKDRKWVLPNFADAEIAKKCRMIPSDFELKEWENKFGKLQGFFTKDFSATKDMKIVKVKSSWI